MSQPIILDGGARMISIKLPTYFKKIAKEGGKFLVSPTSKDTPFQRIVVTDHHTGEVVLNWSLGENRQWKIEIQ